MLKNQRHELFSQGIISGKSAQQAYIDAGYLTTNAPYSASRLLRNDKVQSRIKELQEKATSSKILTVIERKEILSEIARARYSDFATAGPDGSWIDIGPESINSRAICEVRSRTEYDKDGDKPSVIISVKLHDPIRALAELNKMEGAYAPVEQKIVGTVKTETTVIHKHDWSKIPDEKLEPVVRMAEEFLQQVSEKS